MHVSSDCQRERERSLEQEAWVKQEVGVVPRFHNYSISCFITIKIMILLLYHKFLFDKLQVMNDFTQPLGNVCTPLRAAQTEHFWPCLLAFQVHERFWAAFILETFPFPVVMSYSLNGIAKYLEGKLSPLPPQRGHCLATSSFLSVLKPRTVLKFAWCLPKLLKWLKMPECSQEYKIRYLFICLLLHTNEYKPEM